MRRSDLKNKMLFKSIMLILANLESILLIVFLEFLCGSSTVTDMDLDIVGTENISLAFGDRTTFMGK